MSDYNNVVANEEDGEPPVELQRKLLAKTKTDKINLLLKKSTQLSFINYRLLRYCWV